DLEYTLIVKAPENAVSYVLSEYAEAAAEATLEAANDVSEGKVEIAIKITDSEAKVITGNYPSFIKWYNENGEEIIIEAVTVTVETDKRAATREATFNVNRRIGTVEALLTGNSDEIDDYYAYFNGYLSGSGVSNKYSLSLNASFDKADFWQVTEEI